LLKRFKEGDATAGAFRAALAVLDGAASRWPRDEEFRKAWMTEPVHSRLGDIGRIRTILAEIENGMRSRRTEEAFTLPQGLLDVDHIMPDRWYEHWPLVHSWRATIATCRSDCTARDPQSDLWQPDARSLWREPLGPNGEPVTQEEASAASLSYTVPFHQSVTPFSGNPICI
jgi:hypothetical protein